ncbi:hypothetical protein ACFWM0_06260 [Streptomyces sp. NPDC058405]|uniref:hypothetical protein n=1 Tax=unclassified Streptomyces TaxID=2593676 RepID=UPI003663FE62
MRAPQAVIVLDGVSTLAASTPLGGWYADCLGMELAAGLTRAPDGDLREILEGAIGAVTARHGLVPGESPAATVAIARLHNDQVEALVLADTPVIALLRAGVWTSCATTGSLTWSRSSPGIRSIRTGCGPERGSAPLATGACSRNCGPSR